MHLFQNAETIDRLVKQGELRFEQPTMPSTIRIRPASMLSSCVATSQAGAARYTRCTAIARKKLLIAFAPKHACPSPWEI